MDSIYGEELDRYRERVRTFLQTHAQARLAEFEHKGVDLHSGVRQRAPVSSERSFRRPTVVRDSIR